MILSVHTRTTYKKKYWERKDDHREEANEKKLGPRGILMIDTCLVVIIIIIF